MKKKILLTLLVLVLLGVLGLIVFISRFSQILASQEPLLEKYLGDALHSPVDLDGIEVHLFPAPRISLSTLHIGKNELSKNKQGLHFEDVILALHYGPLFRGNLAVSELSLENPHVRFLKSKGGYRIDGLQRKGKQAGMKAKMRNPQASNQTAKKADLLPSFLTLDLESIRIKNGTLEFVEENGKSTEVKELTLQARMQVQDNLLTFDRPTLSAKIKDSVPIDLKGDALLYHLETKTASLENFRVNIPGGSLLLDGQVNTKEQLGSIEIPSFELSPAVLRSALSGGEKSSSSTATIRGKGQMSLLGPGKMTSTFEGEAFEGSWKLNVSFANGFQDFQSQVQAKTMQLEPLLAVTKQEDGEKSALQGTLNNLRFSASGKLGKDFLPTLRADGNTKLSQLRIEGLNILGQTLGALQDIPALGDSLLSRLSPAQKALLTQDFTNFTDIHSKFRIQENTAYLDDLSGRSDAFRINGKGSILQLRDSDLQASIFLQAVFAESLVAAVKEVKYLLNKEGEILVPVRITGPLGSKIKVKPDTELLLKTILHNGGGEKAKDILGKALGDKDLGKSLGNLLGL